MLGEEFCQVRLRWKEQDRQVTAIHHVATQCRDLFNEPAKIGVEFRCAARDIDRWNIGLSERPDALRSRFAGHALSTVRPRIDVTMSAGLVAELADIDLKDGDPSGAKREQTNVLELRLEGGGACDPLEHLQLRCWGGKGALLS